jgi:hypothetical protein
MRTALLLCVFLGSCGLADRRSDRIQIIPSAWEIVSVDGSALDTAALPTLAIDRNNTARLFLGCGVIYLRYISDTDGQALSFGEKRVDARCAESSDQSIVAVREALKAVDEWRVTSDASIAMVSGDGRTLLALRMGSVPSPAPDPT